jgi:hypothetical protein
LGGRSPPNTPIFLPISRQFSMNQNSGGVRILNVQAHSKCGSSIMFR